MLYTIRWLHCSAQLEDDLIWKNQQTFFFFHLFSNNASNSSPSLRAQKQRQTIRPLQKAKAREAKAEG